MTGLLIGCLLAAATAPPAAMSLKRYDFKRREMGVSFRIALYAPDEAVANRAAEAAFRRIKQLNGILSDYNPDSELMQLCHRSGPGRPIRVSRDLQRVLSRSLAISRQTEGAFDVTVGAVVKLWRRARRKKQFPRPERLAAARKLIGYRAIVIVPRSGTVELRKQGMRLDLGGIAKGYAGDAALAVLNRHGVTRALIDASGDIVVGDPPPGKTGWRIGLASIGKPDAPPTRFLSIHNAAVATSGDAYQYVEIGGKRYSHIVDPRTGIGLTRRSSVTVIAADGATADALASAVSVLGPKCGLKLIDTLGTKTAAMVVVLKDNRPHSVRSRRFEQFEFRKR